VELWDITSPGPGGPGLRKKLVNSRCGHNREDAPDEASLLLAGISFSELATLLWMRESHR